MKTKKEMTSCMQLYVKQYEQRKADGNKSAMIPFKKSLELTNERVIALKEWKPKQIHKAAFKRYEKAMKAAMWEDEREQARDNFMREMKIAYC